MDSESKKVFRVITTCVDDRWCVWESDVKGLFLETDFLPEMKECIEFITPMFLMKNHNLTETDLANVEVRVTIKYDGSKLKQRSGKATLVFYEERELAVP